MAEEIKKVITVDTSKGITSIKGLKTEIQSLKKSLESLNVDSQEYENTLVKLAKTQRQYSEITKEISERSKPVQQSVLNFTSLAEGLAKSYSAVNAVIGLVSDGNEDLAKTLAKTARIIQLIQGLPGFKVVLQQIPRLINYFKQLGKEISPVLKQLTGVKSDLNDLKDVKIDVSGSSPNSSTTITADNKALKEQTQILNQQAQTIYPALIEKQKELQKSQKQLGETIASKLNPAFRDLIVEQLKGVNLSKENVNRQRDLSNAVAAASYNYVKTGHSIEEAQEQMKLLANEDFTKLTEELTATNKQMEALGNETPKAVSGLKKVGNTLKSLFKASLYTVAITAIITGIYKIIDALKKAASTRKEIAKLNLEIDKGANKIAAEGVVRIKELSIAYRKLGDDANAKSEFLKTYAEQIKATGIAINDVNTADDVFIKNTDKYIAAVKNRAIAQATENKAIELYQEYLDKRSELESKIERQQEIAGFSASGTTELLERYKTEIKDLDISIEETLNKLFKSVAELDAEYAGLGVTITNTTKKDLEDTTKKDLEELAKYYKEARDLFKDARTKELDDINAKYNTQIELAKKYNKDTVLLEQARQREINEVIKKYSDQAEQDRLERIDKEYSDLQTSIERIREAYNTSSLKNPAQANYQTTYKQNWATYGLGLGNWTNTYQSKSDVQNELASQLEYNNKFLELTKSRIEQENALLNQQLQIEGLDADKKLEIKRQLAENEMALSNAVTENEKANSDAIASYQNKKQQALNSTLNVASTLLGGLANIYRQDSQNQNKSEKEQKKALKAYKVLAISQATIDTYKAANEAYASLASVPYVGPALGAAAAAAAIVAGIANVKSIISESSISTSSASSASVDAPAQIANYPVEYTRNLLGDREIEQLNRDNKVYLVESELRDFQNKVQIREQNASF